MYTDKVKFHAHVIVIIMSILVEFQLDHQQLMSCVDMESYQKIQQMYKEEVKDILESPHVVIEEKVDGSQFRVEIDNGVMSFGSHHQEGPMVDGMFKRAIESAKNIFSFYGDSSKYTIFCEYLGSQKQNTLFYERVPKNNLVVFDVKVNDKYLDRAKKEKFCIKYDVDIVPCLFQGKGSDVTPTMIDDLLKKESFLGRARIEGIVIKAYDTFYDVNKYPYLQGHWKCAKIVRPEFQEMNKQSQPSNKNHIDELKSSVCTKGRWDKAIQHLKEKGELTNDLSDLGKLIPEIQRDLEEEEKETIKNSLWNIFGKEIIRSSIKGFPEYYKERLLSC